MADRWNLHQHKGWCFASPPVLCWDQKSRHLLWGVPGDADHHSVSSHPRHENPLLAGSIYTKQMLRFKYVLKPFWAGPRLGFRDVLESFWQCWFQLGWRGDVESCIAAATLEFWNVLIKTFCYQPFPSYAGQNPPGYKHVWNDSYVLMLSWIWINFNTFYNTCIPAKTKPMTSAWFEHTFNALHWGGPRADKSSRSHLTCSPSQGRSAVG